MGLGQGIVKRARNAIDRAVYRGWVKSHPATREIVGGLNLTGRVPHAEDLIANAGAYRVCSWVYSCVYAIATSGSTLPMMLYRKRGRRFEEWERLYDHPVLDLLDQEPNDHEWETGQTLREALYSDMELTGNCYVYLLRDDGGRPVELHRLRPDRMQIVPDAKEFVLGYLYDVNGKKVAFDREEVAHRRNYNPTDDFNGLSPISAGRLAITGDVQSSLWNLTFFKNSAVPRGVLKLAKDAEDPGEARRRELETEWRKAYKGTDKSHRTAVLPPGMEFQGIGIPPKDMEFVLQQKMDRERIASIFRVPPVMIGIFEYANYANSHEQKLSFWHETMMPKIRAFDDMFTKAIARPWGEDLVVRTDLSGVWALVKDQREAMEIDVKAVQSGMSYPNERRAERGLGPVPWGNDYMMPINLAPWSETWGRGRNPLGDTGGTSSSDGGQESISNPRAPSGYIAPRHYEVRGRELYEHPVLKQAAYASWAALLIPLKRQFSARWSDILDDQEAEVLEKLRQSELGKVGSFDIESVLFNYEYWKDGTVKRMRPHYVNVANESGLFTLGQLGLEMEFDLTRPFIRQAMEDKMFVFAEEVNEATLEKLRGTLDAGMTAGENQRELVSRVQTAFNGRKANAGVVATTEVGAVSNAGNYSAYEQSGVVGGRRWYAGGPNPRPHHEIANAENGVVPLGQPFIVMGERMLYPGDPSGSPENVCNCQCATLAIVRE
jgi:HK97 family phage portal protein